MIDLLSREIDLQFNNLSEWQAWYAEHAVPALKGPYLDEIVAHVLLFGVREPITGTVFPGSDILRGGDLREGLVARGINSRQRAVMRVIECSLGGIHWHKLRIYAPEAVTALALRLRGIFPKFIGSEFTLDEERRAEMYPIALEDLTALTLPSDRYDMVTTNEVLEHVPDIDAALSEMARILKPGGWHIGTHPLANIETSIVKSRLENGAVVHVTEPEYHGDPFNDTGSLVFEIPGWDILERAKRAGFADAHFRLIVSQQHGCLCATNLGILVLCCQK